ncbi:MAG: hypothetical protein GY884_19695, partial [Proteobacteria bacterium]|nr:hypothetical protein [Pseudomonadota bacterium]
MPFAIVASDVTVQLGALDGRAVRVTTGNVPLRLVDLGLDLPGVSLVLEFSRELTEEEGGGAKAWLDTCHVEAALQLAAEAVSAGETTLALTLATLVKVVKPVSTASGIVLDLPDSLKDEVLDRPLLPTVQGRSSIRDLLRALGTDDFPDLRADAIPEAAAFVAKLLAA